ncbi:MAG: nuclear transport factor 2 family protein [Balneolaceae bacterium]
MTSLKLLPLFVLLMFSFVQCTPENSGENDEVVSAVINNFFDAMRASDGDQIRSLITSETTLKTVTVADVEPVLRETAFDRFISSVEGSEPGTLDEQLTSLTIHVDDNLATAWMGYRFYHGEEFSHCGVNTMNLLKKSDGWKIVTVVDTRRSDCD